MPEENWPPTEPGFSQGFFSPLGHLMKFFGSLPLLPLACSVGDILGIFNLILSINKFLLKQTLLYYFNLIL
ncbi:hypothetical protein PO909_017477 [Leuciscus waleckii]